MGTVDASFERGAFLKHKLPFFAVYTDGACSGNPGPGGWGAILIDPQGQVREMGGGSPETTNNRMEVRAAMESLREIGATDLPIHIYTDSTYLIRGVTQWIWGWRKRNWVTAEGNEVQNRDLWEDLSRLVPGLEIEWNYVRGHRGIIGNERCDEIAVAYSKGKKPKLFRGDWTEYPYDVLSFPEKQDLPEMRPKEEKKVAFSYLSELGGQVVRHRTWADCERRVKGRSGAKFKKAMSQADELEILKAWGVSPSSVSSD